MRQEHQDANEKARKRARRRCAYGGAGILGGAAFFTAATLVIQTNVVELGYESNYDGTVMIQRDASGRMTFRDNEVATPVTLAQLGQGVDTHAALFGLTADDHPQYHNDARHSAAHAAEFNGALAIDPDVNNNATLGAHLGDAAIHLHRDESESIGGDWIFGGAPEFRADLYLSDGGSAGDSRVRFEAGAADAEILWNHAADRFAFNRDVSTAGSLIAQGTGASSFAGLVRIDNGAAGSNAIADGPGDLYVEETAEIDGDVFVGGKLGVATTSAANHLTFGASTAFIASDTADAADSKAIVLAGGGASGVTRGGSVAVYGNEHSIDGGDVILRTGNRAGADVELWTADPANNLALRVSVKDDSGFVGIHTSTPATELDVDGDVTIGGAIDQNGAAQNAFAGEAEFAGGIEVDSIQSLSGTPSIDLDGSSVRFPLNVGINGVTPSEELDVNGAVALREWESISGAAGMIKLYAVDVSGTTELFARDGAGNETQLTSHNFEGFAPDPDEPLPFSFHAANEFVGARMWADLSGALRELELLTGRAFIHYEDLPTTGVLDVADWRERERERMELEERRRRVAESPTVEVPESEAWEWVEIETEQIVETPATRYAFDPASGQIVERAVVERVVVRVPTGELTRRLKPGVRLDERTGVLLRARRLDEVGDVQIPEPTLPAWVMDRLPPERAARLKN
jgi:ethanolamine utilization microcompartment shell protein EutS